MQRLLISLALLTCLSLTHAAVLETDRVGLYNPETGSFLLEKRNGGYLEFQYKPQGWQPGWLPLAGDWNGDGKDTVGLFDPVNSRFYLESLDQADYVFRFGPLNSGWLPLAGDWNGDGKDTIGLYNPNAGRFFLRNTLSGGVAEIEFPYGGSNNGRLPIVGDWNGNGFDTVGVYAPMISNPSRGVFFLRNALTGGNADIRFDSATNGIPVVGDWNGDGIDTVGLYGGFLLKSWLDDSLIETEFRQGPFTENWRPIAGNWDERDRGVGNGIPAPPPPGPEPSPPSQCAPVSDNVVFSPNSSSFGALPAGLQFDWHSNRKLMFRLGTQIHSHPVRTSNSTSESGQIVFAKTSGTSATKTVAISKCPGDFNVEPICIQEAYEAGAINWTQGAAALWQCPLEPNTRYYINIRNGSLRFPGTGACTSSSCDYLFQMVR